MYLEHFGILGMKWGVRRYQNKDGSLTQEGKKRYSIKDETDDSFTLEKGSTLYRIANQDEKLSPEKEKYYSVKENDREHYKELLYMGGLFLDRTKPYGEFVNSTENDLKIKKGERVVQDLIDKYGKESAEELTKYFENQKELRKEIPDKEKRNNYISGFSEDSDSDKFLEDEYAYSKINDFVWDVMKEHGDDVVRNYREMGYDGIVDPFDFVANVADMPLIVTNPHGTVSQKSFRKLSI